MSVSSEDSKIVTISSNKGGVGKTSIAITAGLHLSNKKNESTLLLELDSSPGDFASLFDIDGNKTLDMAIKFPESHYKYTKKITNNLFVMGGITNPVIAESIKRKDFYNLLEFLKLQYQNIIFDTQTVLNGLMVDAYQLSRKIILITDYSFESISRILALYNFINTNLSISKNKVDIVVNKKKIFDFLKIWDYTKITGIPLAGFISFDKRFTKSFFLTNHRRVFKTRFYRQFRKVIEDEFKEQVT